jgi:hypothetical protein
MDNQQTSLQREALALSRKRIFKKEETGGCFTGN